MVNEHRYPWFYGSGDSGFKLSQSVNVTVDNAIGESEKFSMPSRPLVFAHFTIKEDDKSDNNGV